MTGHAQRGFTLTSLLVSLVLGGFLVAGMLSVFLGGLETFRTTDALARMQESGRFALEILRRDLRQAGFVGCRNSLRQELPRGTGALGLGLIRNTLNPAPSGGSDPLPFEFDFQLPVVGYEATGDGTGSSWTAADPIAAAPGSVALFGNARDDSDIIVTLQTRGTGILVDTHSGGSAPLPVSREAAFRLMMS